MKYDMIADRIAEISETLVSELKDYSKFRLGDLKKHEFPKEIRERIEVEKHEAKLKLKSNGTHYFIMHKKKVLYGNVLTEFDQGNAVELSLAIDFSEKEELVLLCIYAGLERRDLLENLLKEPYVLMMAGSQI